MITVTVQRNGHAVKAGEIHAEASTDLFDPFTKKPIEVYWAQPEVGIIQQRFLTVGAADWWLRCIGLTR